MKKYMPYAFHFFLLLVSLLALDGSANAQSSLIFRDPAGNPIEFTNFGTIVYPNQHVATRGYEILYSDASGARRAWYLDRQYNYGIVPVSLSADRANGSTLSIGEAVFVRARMKTIDNKLEIVCRYIFKAGAPGIEAVITVENTSQSSVDVGSLSIMTPYEPECQCPCEPVREFDGATVQSFLVQVSPTVRVRKTRAVFASSTLNRNESRDLPGCDGPPTPAGIPIN
jgi:hypothetical protein